MELALAAGCGIGVDCDTGSLLDEEDAAAAEFVETAVNAEPAAAAAAAVDVEAATATVDEWLTVDEELDEAAVVATLVDADEVRLAAVECPDADDDAVEDDDDDDDAVDVVVVVAAAVLARGRAARGLSHPVPHSSSCARDELAPAAGAAAFSFGCTVVNHPTTPEPGAPGVMRRLGKSGSMLIEAALISAGEGLFRVSHDPGWAARDAGAGCDAGAACDRDEEADALNAACNARAKGSAGGADEDEAAVEVLAAAAVAPALVLLEVAVAVLAEALLVLLLVALELVTAAELAAPLDDRVTGGLAPVLVVDAEVDTEDVLLATVPDPAAAAAAAVPALALDERGTGTGTYGTEPTPVLPDTAEDDDDEAAAALSPAPAAAGTGSNGAGGGTAGWCRC